MILFKYCLDKYSKIQEYKIRIFYSLKKYCEKFLIAQKLFKLDKVIMKTNTLIIILFLIFFLIFLVLLFTQFFYSKRKQRPVKEAINTQTYKPFLKEQEFNPDISTNNWDLHKLRLVKFRRSQYKGLTFFVSSENRIYYLSEEGDKVYC